jgi:bifunctional ADP-heptose synthase (sugar kinase/adenylyltransferase)
VSFRFITDFRLRKVDLKKKTFLLNIYLFAICLYYCESSNDLFVQTVYLELLLHSCVDLCQDLLRTVQVVLVTLGEEGSLLVRRGSANEQLPLRNDNEVKEAGSFVTSAKFYPVQKAENVVCVSGAGDCFAAAFISSVIRGGTQDRAVAAGIQAAKFCLGYTRSVPVDMGRNVIDWNREAQGRVIL